MARVQRELSAIFVTDEVGSIAKECRISKDMIRVCVGVL